MTLDDRIFNIKEQCSRVLDTTRVHKLNYDRGTCADEVDAIVIASEVTDPDKRKALIGSIRSAYRESHERRRELAQVHGYIEGILMQAEEIEKERAKNREDEES